MKIFQVLNHFLPQHTAGTEIYTWALSKQLQKLGHEIEIIIPNFGSNLNESYTYDGLKIFKFAENSVVDRDLIVGNKKSNGLFFFKKYIQEQKPDIIHFHELAGSNGIALAHLIEAKEIGVKIVFTFHLAGYTCKTNSLLFKDEILCDGKIDLFKCSKCYINSKAGSNTNNILFPISNILYRLGFNTLKFSNKIGTALGTIYVIEKHKKYFDILIKNCDQVVSLTDWYKKVLLLNGVDDLKINLIKQGLPFRNISLPTKKVEIDSKLKIIFLGRISYHKGLHLLIDAMLNLDKSKVELNIYGQSTDFDYEIRLKEKTKFFSNIIWNAVLPQTQVAETISNNDILCLCSTFSEMSPLVIQESFAVGTPVLASNVYGNAEQIIDGENGWLFKFKNPKDLQKKIEILIQDKSLLSEAKLKIKQVNGFAQIAKQQEIVYKNTLSNI